jgi:hypothetical protein
MEAFRGWCAKLEELCAKEEKCLYFGFSFDGDKAYCREGYAGAEGVFEHLENVGAYLDDVFSNVEVERIEFHGPAEELAKLKETIESLGANAYAMEYGFRK